MSSDVFVDFQTIPCAEFCSRVADGTHDSPKEVSSGKKLATSKNIKDGRLNLDSAYLISEDDFNTINKRSKVDQWDLLLTMIGTVGEVCVIREPAPDFAIKNVGLLKTGNEKKAKWLYYFLRSPLGQEAIEQRKKGSTQQYISLTEIRNLPVSFPQCEKVMSSIVEHLEMLDDRITLLRETNATLEAIAQALFKSWFVDFDPVRAKAEGRSPDGMDEATAALFPDAFEESELGPMPRGWGVGALSDLATYLNGYAFKTKDWQEAGHPVVKIGNVKPGLINVSGASCVSPKVVGGLERFKLKRGDLLVGMTGYVGETGLVPSIDPPAYLNQRVGKIATKRGVADLGFIYCLVRNPAYKTHAELKSHGSAQANVSGADLMAYPCVLPAPKALAAFNEILSPIIEGILENHDKAQTLATLRDTLLPRLISGELRLPEAEATLDEATS